MLIYSKREKHFFHSIVLLQEMWLFNNAMRQKEIYSMLIYGKENAANISMELNQCQKSRHVNNGQFKSKHVILKITPV